MTTLFKLGAAGLLALGLSACASEPDTATLDPNAAGGGAAGALDPNSIAYFNTTIGDRVFFALDSSRLDGAAQATLASQAQWLLANPAISAVIEGHADERGTRDYNLALGARRAQAARDYLAAQGVPAARLRVVSYGKERPVAVCANESCWSQNRRSVTVAAGGATS